MSEELHRDMLRRIEVELSRLGLTEDPRGDGDFAVFDDYHGRAVARVAMYFESLNMGVLDVLKSVATEFGDAVEIEVGFFERDPKDRLPPLTVSTKADIAEADLADYGRRFADRLQLRGR